MHTRHAAPPVSAGNPGPAGEATRGEVGKAYSVCAQEEDDDSGWINARLSFEQDRRAQQVWSSRARCARDAQCGPWQPVDSHSEQKVPRQVSERIASEWQEREMNKAYENYESFDPRSGVEYASPCR
jgi:hypothetical protein